MKKILLILIAFFVSTIGYSQTFTENNITYEVTSTTTVKTTGYNSAGGTVVNVPATVTNNSTTYNVTEIGVQSFFSSSLTSVTIPDSVEIIGASAFSNNNNLTSATIGEGVTSIGTSAFFGADLSSIIIPNNVVSIGNQAFDLNNLTSVTFGTGLTTIGLKAFLNNNLTNVVLPQSLTTIKGEAFKGNNLTSVTIPENVTTIENLAFGGNPLTTVTSLNQTPPVITINQVFANRANIDLIIPTGTATAYSGVIAARWQGFKTVSDSSFLTFTINKIVYEVTSTTNNTAKTVDFLVPSNSTNNVVNIPTNVTANSITYTVTEIENYSFLGGGTQPNLISTVVIPDGITRIGYQAFRFNGLTSLTIPDSVETIGSGAFWLNTNLSNVTFGSNVISIGDYAFMACNIATIVFPSNLTTIGFQAFKNNQLSNVTIPNNVTSIGFEAFSGNPLTDVTSMATTPPSISTGSSDTFADDRSSINLHIPQGTAGVYTTNSGALWTGFNSVVEDAPLNTTNFVLANDVKITTSKNELRIISNNSVQLQNYTVYNIAGVEVSNGKENIIPTNSLSKGIYILNLKFNKGTFTKKVIIN